MYKKSEIESVTLEKVVNLVEIPNFQRSEDEIHTDDIFNFEVKHMKNYGYFLFPGIISMGIIKDKEKMMVLDGQHRIKAIQKILLSYPQYSREKVNILKIFGTEDYHFDIYNRINCNKKVELIWAKNTAEVINRSMELLKKNFKDFTKTNAENPQRPNINIAQLTQALSESKIVETLKITDYKDLYDKLIEMNQWFSCCSKLDFKSWGIPYEEGKEEKNGKKFYLGLYNRDFEFIRSIIIRYRDNINYIDQQHNLNIYNSYHQKEEFKLWDELSNKGRKKINCSSCDCELKRDNFCCVLKKSFYNGGKREKNNLVIVCEQCDLDIGRQNFNDFMSKKEEIIISDGKKEESDLIFF